MGEQEARDSTRPNPTTQPDDGIYVDWNVLFGNKHFVPQPAPPAPALNPEPQIDYLRDICKDGGLAMWRDPCKLSYEAYENFKRFDLNKDGKLSLPEVKLIENNIDGDSDDRKLAFALDKGFNGLQKISGTTDGITQDGLAKFNHLEDYAYMYALEHHGGSNSGLLTYLGTAVAAGAICCWLRLPFWRAAVVTTAAATIAYLLKDDPHYKQQEAELHDLRSLQPTADELIKSVQSELPQKPK